LVCFRCMSAAEAVDATSGSTLFPSLELMPDGFSMYQQRDRCRGKLISEHHMHS
jgi:hypothetical protein